MAVSDVDDDAESLPGSTTSSGASALLPDHLNVIRTFEHTIEEGEFYCGGELYTAQWYMLEYRRHKSRKSGIYLPSPAAKSIQHTVVMKDWSFVALDPTRTPMHLTGNLKEGLSHSLGMMRDQTNALECAGAS